MYDHRVFFVHIKSQSCNSAVPNHVYTALIGMGSVQFAPADQSNNVSSNKSQLTLDYVDIYVVN